MLHHDLDKGWVTHEGEPRWRATPAAVDRVTGQDIKWLDRTGRAHIAHLPSGTPVASIRCYPMHKRFAVSMEGFTFWSFNRILGHEHFSTVQGFNRLRDARRFVKTVLSQASGKLP